jgi:uncharacterized membrane protein YcaP (DUF421 family)
MNQAFELDWQRLLLGATPWQFLLEVLVRLVCVYPVLVLVVRLFGKRLSGRVGNLELAVMIALGAIVSVPIQEPTRGVLPGLLLLFCLLGMQRGLGALGVRYPRIEEATQNRVGVLVVDGELQLHELRSASISAEQLFAVLRSQGLRQLGEARRVYLEAYGSFSVYRQEPPRDGLSLAPDWDSRAREALPKAVGASVCRACGHVEYRSGADSTMASCPRCGARHWVEAISGSR